MARAGAGRWGGRVRATGDPSRRARRRAGTQARGVGGVRGVLSVDRTSSRRGRGRCAGAG
ncbi:hypothetical protein TOK_1126 [Pseudonocardia sp. N23]|nr:hypothetical protein TOK_1126 [Pseudonocardia sp. N23]